METNHRKRTGFKRLASVKGWKTFAIVCLIGVGPIPLLGCGQKGPLVLPSPQFPDPGPGQPASKPLP